MTKFIRIFSFVLISLLAHSPYAFSTDIVTHIHTDVLGSPIAATAADGSLVWRETFKPYGEKMENALSSDENDVWYTSRPFDEEIGLSFNGARDYDPVIGRFYGIDPVSFQEDNFHSFNRYTYANNNPYFYVDRTGEAGRYYGVPPTPQAVQLNINLTYKGVPTNGTRRPQSYERQIKEANATGSGKVGSAGVDRTGKVFTPKTKRDLDADNAARNGGVNRCEKCGIKTVPGQQSQRGVTPPPNERQRDHIISRKNGGDGTFQNGQILCRGCNLDKAAN